VAYIPALDPAPDDGRKHADATGRNAPEVEVTVSAPYRPTKIGIDPTAYVAPGAALLGEVTVGARASIWFHATVRGDLEPVTIGAESNVQDGCVIHVDHGRPTRIGERVTLGHGAIVHAATVGDECLIAMRAVVLSGSVIGRHCLIGAGAVVPEGMTVPEGSLVLGLPGRVVRPLRPEEIARIRDNARSYVDLAGAYRAGGLGGPGAAR
jgi:carbonic anhydrase/acetyltransferase-like protein (isoleucine patch superfamily)